MTAAAAFAELGALAVSTQPLAEILERTVELARTVVVPTGEASVTVIVGDDARTPAATDGVAATLDETQYAVGHGPCLDAARAGQIVMIAETAEEQRWPEYAKAALDSGVHSSMSVPLPVQREVIGALNLYSGVTLDFTDEHVRLAEQFASYAALAIGNTALYMNSTQLAAQMQEAMTSRAVIEQAKGIVMALEKVSAEEAFHVLVKASQRSHRKLRDVAAEYVRSVTDG